MAKRTPTPASVPATGTARQPPATAPPIGLALVLLAGWAVALPGGAAPSLVCEVGYGGDTQQVVAHPVTDPYPVPSVDIAGRFRFKPVLVVSEGDGVRHGVRRVLVYVYRQAGEQAVLIQQAKYLPPFASPDASGVRLLTGRQYLYAGELERELFYQCSLQGVGP